METTIDSAGRIVVPKSLREAMHLRPGQVVDIIYADGRLEIAVPTTPAHLVRNAAGRLVAATEVEMPPLSAEATRDTLEEVRR